MGILVCEFFFRDVWIRNKSVRPEIGQILRTHKHTHTHTTAAKLVVRVYWNGQLVWTPALGIYLCVFLCVHVTLNVELRNYIISRQIVVERRVT